MLIADFIRLATRSLGSHRLRSFLTLLGIAVGIAAVILLTSIGEGIHRFVLAEFTQFGTNVIGINPGKSSTHGASAGILGSVRLLTLDDAAAIRRLPQIDAVSPAVWGNGEVEARGRIRRTFIYGVGAEMTRALQMRVSIGRFLPDDELGNARAHAVLGAKLRNELFGSANPLGERVRVGGVHFRVIGVMAPKGQILGLDLDDTIYIPTSRGMELFNREGLMEINAAYTAGADDAEVAGRVRDLLVARHGREDFTLTTQADMLRTLSNVLGILTFAVGTLGGISLLVGGVGIVTIMTIAVAERTGEIGLLVALGARRRTVMLLFLGEASGLAAIGGLLGLVLGIGLAQALHAAVPGLPVHTPWSFVVLAEVIAIAIGLAAGVLPASRAARMDPVEALRAE